MLAIVPSPDAHLARVRARRPGERPPPWTPLPPHAVAVCDTCGARVDLGPVGDPPPAEAPEAPALREAHAADRDARRAAGALESPSAELSRDVDLYARVHAATIAAQAAHDAALMPVALNAALKLGAAGWVFGAPVGSEAPAYCNAHAADLPPPPPIVEPEPAPELAAGAGTAPEFELVTAPGADATPAERTTPDIAPGNGPAPDADEPVSAPPEPTPAPTDAPHDPPAE